VHASVLVKKKIKAPGFAGVPTRTITMFICLGLLRGAELCLLRFIETHLCDALLQSCCSSCCAPHLMVLPGERQGVGLCGSGAYSLSE